MKYERPELAELDLELEGSFLDSSTSVDREDGEVSKDDAEQKPNKPSIWG